jgi:hypothetical protein
MQNLHQTNSSNNKINGLMFIVFVMDEFNFDDNFCNNNEIAIECNVELISQICKEL